MPMIPDPFTHPDIWERLVLIVPGIVQPKPQSLEDWKRFGLIPTGFTVNGRLVVPGIIKIDVKGGIRESRQDAPGENGARAKYLGWRDAEITIDIVVYDDLQFNVLTGTINTLITPRGKKGRPIVCDAAHPQLAMFGVRSIYVTDFTARDFQPLEGFGITINAREFIEEAFKVTKVVTNTKDTGKNGKDGKGGSGSSSGKGSSGSGSSGSGGSSGGSGGGNPNKPNKPSKPGKPPSGPAAAARANPSAFIADRLKSGIKDSTKLLTGK